VVVALSEYESQGLAAHEALALGRPLVVNDSTALRELAVHPGVRAVAPTAPPAQVAAAILDAISAPPGPPVPFPTWADCVTALLDVYRNIGIT
jgi:glycosyltransferase involved in cell wall biosynthesis